MGLGTLGQSAPHHTHWCPSPHTGAPHNTLIGCGREAWVWVHWGSPSPVSSTRGIREDRWAERTPGWVLTCLAEVAEVCFRQEQRTRRLRDSLSQFHLTVDYFGELSLKVWRWRPVLCGGAVAGTL